MSAYCTGIGSRVIVDGIVGTIIDTHKTFNEDNAKYVIELTDGNVAVRHHSEVEFLDEISKFGGLYFSKTRHTFKEIWQKVRSQWVTLTTRHL